MIRRTFGWFGDSEAGWRNTALVVILWHKDTQFIVAKGKANFKIHNSKVAGMTFSVLRRYIFIEWLQDVRKSSSMFTKTWSSTERRKKHLCAKSKPHADREGLSLWRMKGSQFLSRRDEPKRRYGKKQYKQLSFVLRLQGLRRLLARYLLAGRTNKCLAGLERTSLTTFFFSFLHIFWSFQWQQ